MTSLLSLNPSTITYVTSSRYVACYKELVDKETSSTSCLLLGDAYMHIQEPQRAIAVYEAGMYIMYIVLRILRYELGMYIMYVQ